MQQSHTAFKIQLSTAHINWYSKKQATIETSTFGAQYINVEIIVETYEAYNKKYDGDA